MVNHIERECWVLPENWEAVKVFISAQTQWRKAVGMSAIIYEGFDYQGLKILLDYTLKKEDQADCFERLQIMERKALTLFNAS